MASFRKKHLNGDSDKAEPPVATAPRGVTTAPPVIDEPKPETPKVDDAPADPVGEAARASLKSQLAEMVQAERLTAQRQPEQDESPQAPQDPLEAFLEGMPEPTRKFLRANPEYMTDAEKNAALQHYHWVAKRETGEEFTPRYVESLERHLGLRGQPQPTNGNGAQRPVQSAQRQSAPVRPSGPPVSAPPTREAPSMTTGRPPTAPTQLTAEEYQLAQAMGITAQEYLEGKKKMLREKSAGMHGNG